VANPAVNATSTSTEGAATTSPATAAGNLLVAFITHSDTDTNPVPVPDSSWNQAYFHTTGVSDVYCVTVQWKVVGTSDPSTYTWSSSQTVIIAEITNAHPTNPFPGSATYTATTTRDTAPGTRIDTASTAPVVGALPLQFSFVFNLSLTDVVTMSGLASGWTQQASVVPTDGYGFAALMSAAAATSTTTSYQPQETFPGSFTNDLGQDIVIYVAPFTGTSALSSADYTAIANAVLNSVIEAPVSSPAFPAITVKDCLQAFLAIFCGRSSGAGTTNPIYYDPSGTRQRVTAVVDGTNNRTTMGLTFS
jgi:hypothetical protein